jgi:hypothetical protein
MEPSGAPFAPPPREGPSREELEKALADYKEDDLKEMAKRLVKSHESLNIMLEDLEAEKQGLQEENTEVTATIDRFMKELQKLNIGADNTVDPQLQEGPMIFANRWWEKLKPRDNGVVVSEHVGEIKKPVPEDEHSPNNNGEKVRQVVENVVENVGSRIGPLWERGLGAWSNFRQKIDERNEQPAQPKRVPKKKKRPVEAEQAAAAAEQAPAPAAAPAVAASPEEAASSAASSSTSTAAAAEVPPEVPVAAPAAAAPKEAVAEEASKGATEEISSTILIEAKLTLDDGSVQTIQVKAADRCKEVAKAFIQEHSLKAWFTEPLTKWLKAVEAEAVKFPVYKEDDLMEIRKRYSKGA